MPYKRFEQENLILRDELAIDRTRLANERTFLAYLRTALALAIVAGTIIHIFQGGLMFLLSLVFFAAAGIFFVIGCWKTLAMHKQIKILRKRSKTNSLDPDA
jgi:putative membrane protein